MKKFLIHLEDLWVAAAFAEAGEYNTLHELRMQPRIQETISIHAV